MDANRIKYLLLFICLTLCIGCLSQTRKINIDSSTRQSQEYELTNIGTDTLIPGYAIFGAVSPKLTENGKFGKFQEVEIYTIDSTGEHINGIERIGPYRLYTTQEFDADTNYRGYPRIEFLDEFGKLIKIVIPTDDLKLFDKQKVAFLKTSGKGINYWAIPKNINIGQINCDNTKDSGFYGSNMYLSTEFDIQNNYLIVKVSFHAFIDMQHLCSSYEVIVYDSFGNVVGRSVDTGQLNIADITSNGQFIYLSSGGPISENRNLPYQFRIIDLKSNKLILNRQEVINERIAGFTIQNTNLGVYAVESTSPGLPKLLEAYVIDHDLNRIYTIHSHKSCPPGSFIYYNQDYCECAYNTSKKVKLYYKKDFSRSKLSD
jgi:hypothetical protein